MQTAAAFRMSEQILADRSLRDVDATSIEPYLTRLWSGFGRRMPAVIAEHSTPAGRDLRRRRLDESRALVADALGGELDDDLVDLLVAITSSSMFLELVDRMGHDPAHAAAMAARLVRIIDSESHPHSQEASSR